MTDQSDRELILQLQDGSLDALGLLYDRHRCMVYRTALAITGDNEVANDLLQDVFLRLYRYADHVDQERPLEPWLYRMTANLAYSWMKRRGRGRRILEEMYEWFLTGSGISTPMELAEEREEWEQVQKALVDLPLAQRVVVVLYYLNEFSLQEISETLDVPIGTVKSRLHYGRRALQQSMKEGRKSEGSRIPELQYEGTEVV
ncbi:MAG: RNA polymerase sigma factor [Chloroflexota bacterium]